MTIGRIPSVEGGIQPTIFDAKADLLTATAADTPARLAVGNNGETLLADSSTTTGLRWQGQFVAGRNAIINGDFRINQRSFSSSTTSGNYGFDRWQFVFDTGTVTYSAQTFTPGTAPVAGYEAANFARIVTSGQSTSASLAILRQKIEDVRTFAGQTVTVSFWAKAASGTPSILPYLVQGFGAGGSPSADVFATTTAKTISTSWARYSFTFTVPSISGKTIGTTANSSSLSLSIGVSAGADYNALIGTLGVQNNTFDIWGVQVEAGSVATPFTTASGTLQGELALCQRYYFRSSPNAAFGPHCQGIGEASTTAVFLLQTPTQLRISAASVDYSALRVSDTSAGTAITNLVLLDGGGLNAVCLRATVASGLTQFRPYFLTNNNNTAGYVAVSAEL